MRTHKQKKKQTTERPKPRRLTVQVKRGQHHIPYPEYLTIPELRINGRWLAALGFAPGLRCTVHTEPGLLLIMTEQG